jgi:hypothetical protein
MFQSIGLTAGLLFFFKYDEPLSNYMDPVPVGSIGLVNVEVLRQEYVQMGLIQDNPAEETSTGAAGGSPFFIF